MTRINCIHPKKLSDKHLVAEYRELPRVFKLANAYYRRLIDGNPNRLPEPDLPQKYTMGKGHVKFFYDKLGYLVRRQKMIIKEMRRRKFKPQHTDPDALIVGMPYLLLNDWRPTKKAIEINEQRILLRGGTI